MTHPPTEDPLYKAGVASGSATRAAFEAKAPSRPELRTFEAGYRQGRGPTGMTATPLRVAAAAASLVLLVWMLIKAVLGALFTMVRIPLRLRRSPSTVRDAGRAAPRRDTRRNRAPTRRRGFPRTGGRAISRLRPRMPGTRTLSRAVATVLVAAITLQALAPAVLARGLEAALPRVAPPPPAMVALLHENLACAQRVKVLDRNDTVLGHLPVKQHCAAIAAWRFTMPSDAQALRFAGFVGLIEGAWQRDSRRTVAGIDMSGLARAGFYWMSGARVGGSNAIVSGYEAALGAGGFSALGKLGSIIDTARFASAELTSDLDRARFITATLPLVIGGPGAAFGAPVGGEMAAETIWGISRFEDLSDGQMCLLAAAVWRQVIVVHAGASAAARREAEDRFSMLKSRAIGKCARRLFESGRISADGLALMTAEIEAMTLRISSRITANPEHAGLFSIAPALGRLAQVEPAVAAAARRGGPLRLHVDVESQFALHHAVREIAAKHAAPGFEPCFDCGKGLDILVVATELADDPVADPAGDRVAALASNRAGLFVGPVKGGARDGATRSVASVSKALIVPVLASGPGRLCPRAGGNLKDYNGFTGIDCAGGKGFMSAEKAFAISSNLATREAVNIAGLDRVFGWLETVGANVHGSAMSDPARGVVTGYAATVSPETGLRVMAAITRGIAGEAPVATLPQLAEGQSRGMIDISGHGVDAAAWKRAGALLRAPLRPADGTMRGLRKPLKDRGCSAIAGKTGSADAAGAAKALTRDRLSWLAVQCGDRRYAIWALIGGPKVTDSIDPVNHAATRALLLAGLDAARSGAVASPAPIRAPLPPQRP